MQRVSENVSSVKLMMLPPNHNFVLYALMIMKFGSDMELYWLSAKKKFKRETIDN